MEIRKLALEYAVKPEHNISMSWQSMNGQENYLSRHPLLSLTSPEAPSLIRIRSLNQHDIECYPTFILVYTILGS